MSGRTQKKNKKIKGIDESIFVERIQHCNHNVVCVVSGTTLLYWVAVGGTGLTGPVQSSLQGRLFRVVLHHAPQLLTHNAGLGPRNWCAGEEWECEYQERERSWRKKKKKPRNLFSILLFWVTWERKIEKGNVFNCSWKGCFGL